MAARGRQRVALGWNHITHCVLGCRRCGVWGEVGGAWVLGDKVWYWVDGAFKGSLVDHEGVQVGWIGDVLGVGVLRRHGGYLIRKYGQGIRFGVLGVMGCRNVGLG